MSTTSIPLVLSVDIGNSNTRLGLVDTRSLRCVASVSFPTMATEQRFEPSWLALVAQAGGTPVHGIAVASVVAAASDELEALASAVVSGPVVRLHGGLNLPVRLSYERPRSLGADRIADALYCAARFPKASCAIIDAGTAVTVDYLGSDGVFAGGAILPGLALQLSSLHQSTAALPPLEYEAEPTHVPGADTRSSMLGGVVYGLAGAVERIVRRYQELPGGVAHVVATGGAWPHIAPLVPLQVIYVPEATLVGTALAVDIAAADASATP